MPAATRSRKNATSWEVSGLYDLPPVGEYWVILTEDSFTVDDERREFVRMTVYLERGEFNQSVKALAAARTEFRVVHCKALSAKVTINVDVEIS